MKTISLTQPISTRSLLVRALAGLLGAVAAFAALPQKADAGVFIGVGVSVGVPPPPLPVYEQPPIPGPGYIWTPGYWAWDGDEYYWVPGTWVIAPFYGALWTPGFWGWDDGFYAFHPGYWGYHVGYYGGIDYGCGYSGVGYEGGYWGPRGFYYNRTVNHISNVNITNVYNKTVINNINVNRVSYNGGRGGTLARATPQQLAYARQSRMGPIAAQQQQMNLARQDPALRASVNHGNPPIAATQRPGVFNGAGVVPAHGTASFTAARTPGGSALPATGFASHANSPAAPRPGLDGRQFGPAAAGVQRMNSNPMHASPTGPNNGMALRSANFAPRANNVANVSGVGANRDLPMRPANFAARANVPSDQPHPAASNSNLYRPGGMSGAAPTSRPMQAVDTYRPAATAYRRAPTPAYHPAPAQAYRPAPAPAYHPAPAPVYRPQPEFRPQPQYHMPSATPYNAYHAAPAAHPMNAAPRGGGRDEHRG